MKSIGKLIVFIIVMLAGAGIANGQAVTIVGSTRNTDTNKAKAYITKFEGKVQFSDGKQITDYIPYTDTPHSTGKIATKWYVDSLGNTYVKWGDTSAVLVTKTELSDTARAIRSNIYVTNYDYFSFDKKSDIFPNGWRDDTYNLETIYDAFGDSYTYGESASPRTDSAYPYILKTRLGATTLNNYGVGGTGVIKTLRQVYQYSPQFRNTHFTTIMSGLNDLRLNMPEYELYTMIYECYRGMLINTFLDTAIGMSNSNITISNGTLSAFGTNPHKAQYLTDNRGVLLNASGYAEWTQNTNNFVVGYLKSTTYGWLEIKIDGYVVDTIKCNENALSSAIYGSLVSAEQIYASARVYRCSTGSSHTIRVTAIATAGASYYPVDYFGIMKSPQSCHGMVIGEIPYISNFYIDYPTGYGYGSKKKVDRCNGIIRYVVGKEFANYPVRVADVNTYYNPITGEGTDGIHPNNYGHKQIDSAFYDAAIVPSFPTHNLQEVTDKGSTTTHQITCPSIDADSAKITGIRFDTRNATGYFDMYYHQAYGVVLNSRGGSAYEYLVANSAGNTVWDVLSGSRDINFYGKIKTAQPSSSGAGQWKLGKKITATVSLVTSSYIEVEIDGVIYKLALVN